MSTAEDIISTKEKLAGQIAKAKKLLPFIDRLDDAVVKFNQSDQDSDPRCRYGIMAKIIFTPNNKAQCGEVNTLSPKQALLALIAPDLLPDDVRSQWTGSGNGDFTFADISANSCDARVEIGGRRFHGHGFTGVSHDQETTKYISDCMHSDAVDTVKEAAASVMALLETDKAKSVFKAASEIVATKHQLALLQDQQAKEAQGQKAARILAGARARVGTGIV